MKNTSRSKCIRAAWLAAVILLGLGFDAGGLVFGEETVANKDWPGWRGRDMNLTVSDAAVFQEGRVYRLEVAWKKKLGSGYSAVSVVDGVAVTLFSDEDWDYAGAFDAETGEELWRVRIGEAHPGHFGSQNGPISTPLIADGRVFALDAAGKLFALDLETGRQIWATDLPKEHDAETPFYGFATSPIRFGDSLIVQTGGSDGKAVTGFEAATGKVLWSSGSYASSYQSPLLVDLDGRPQVLAVGDKQIMGLAPQSGEILWQMEHQGDGKTIGSQTTNLVLGSKSRVLVKNKRSSSMLVQLTPGEEGLNAEELWTSRFLKNTYVVSVHHEGHFYGYNTRILTCVEEESGKLVWRSRPPGDGFPILVNGYLVIATKDGKLSVARASPEGFNEVASVELFDDLVWTPASFANGSLYLRSLSEWARVDIVDSENDVKVAEEDLGIIADSEFNRFIEDLSVVENKKEALGTFMASQTEFPIIEGNDKVHFIYRGPAKDLALVSDIFGARTDRPMNRVDGTDFFFYSVYLEADARLDYRFLKDFEESVNDPLSSRTVRVAAEDEWSYVAMPNWVRPRHLDEPSPEVRGRVETLRLTAQHLEKDITLQVYLPHGYSTAERYPVAYVHEGAVALEVGGMARSLDNLIGKSVRPIIVVFVPFFGEFRYGEYLGEFKDRYVRVLLEEIVPLIDRTYPTIDAPESRATIGRLESAYTSVYATFKHPGVFGKLGLQSIVWEPSYQQQNEALLSSPDRQPLQLYLDWGKYDLRSPMEGWDGPETNRAFARALEEKGYTFTGGEVNDGTGWSSWRNRTDRLLETLFPLR